jgi:transposase InsO family protein
MAQPSDVHQSGGVPKTRIELASAIHDYIERFHNTKRRHSALGMLTPTEYETLHSPIHNAA